MPARRRRSCPTARWSLSCPGCTRSRRWSGGVTGGRSGTCRWPTRRGSRRGGWPRCWTRSRTARPCCPGSSRTCPAVMSSCCVACSAMAGRRAADVGLAVYLPLALPALFAPFAGPLAARLDPVHATWLLTGAAVALAGCSTLALGLLATAAAVRIPLVAGLGHWSLPVLGHNTPPGLAVALLAGILPGAYREARCLPGRGQTVVVADKAADAYALPGRPGRIVVTAGMLSALDEPGRAALLAHEQAHLAGFHYLFTTAARLAATASPLLRPAARAVDYTVERWADERAATVVGDRRLVAQAIGRAALAAKANRPRRATPDALGAVFSGTRTRAHARAGPVPRRVAALLAPPPPRRLVLLTTVIALVALAGICALIAANDLQDLLSLANTHHH